MRTLGLIVVTRCESPPHPVCDPKLTWWRYHIEPPNGRNALDGFVSGSEDKAFAEAKVVLKRMRDIEGQQSRKEWSRFNYFKSADFDVYELLEY